MNFGERDRGVADFETVGTEPVVLSNGLKIMPGEFVWLNSNSVAHNEALFPRPFEYDPYRWMPDGDEATEGKCTRIHTHNIT